MIFDEVKLIVGGVALAALTAGGIAAYYHVKGIGKDECQAEHAADALAQQTKTLAVERQLQDEAHESSLETQRLAALDRVHASRLNAAAPRLLNALNASCRAVPADPAASAGSAAASPDPGVRSDVLGGLVAAISAVGQYADSSRTAGLGCQRAPREVTP